VRNKDELIHGKIPTAIHIPLPEIQEAFQLDSERFKEKYGFEYLTHINESEKDTGTPTPKTHDISLYVSSLNILVHYTIKPKE